MTTLVHLPIYLQIDTIKSHTTHNKQHTTHDLRPEQKGTWYNRTDRTDPNTTSAFR